MLNSNLSGLLKVQTFNSGNFTIPDRNVKIHSFNIIIPTGYTPIGIVGWANGNSPNFYIYSAVVGSNGVVTCNTRNIVEGATTGNVTFYILFAKTFATA